MVARPGSIPGARAGRYGGKEETMIAKVLPSKVLRRKDRRMFSRLTPATMRLHAPAPGWVGVNHGVGRWSLFSVVYGRYTPAVKR